MKIKDGLRFITYGYVCDHMAELNKTWPSKEIREARQIGIKL
jgi:hypothetical protein